MTDLPSQPHSLAPCLFPDLACGPRKDGCVWGGLGRDDEQAAAHTTPWVLQCLEAGSTRAVCAGEGRPRGGRGVILRRGVGVGELWLSSAMRMSFPGLLAGTWPGCGWEPRFWRRGLPEWVLQPPAFGLVLRLLGVQTRAAGGLGLVGRKAGRTSLCGPGGPAAARSLPSPWGSSGLGGLGPPSHVCRTTTWSDVGSDKA